MQVSRQNQYTLVSFVIALFAVGTSYTLQYTYGLTPCPLCLMQRWLLLSISIVLLTAYFAKGRRLQYTLWYTHGLFCCLGGYFAARQLWLQSQSTPTHYACLPGLDYAWHYLPWQQTLSLLLFGSGECGKVAWLILGFSLAAWSLLIFGCLGIIWLVGLRTLCSKKP